MLFTRRLEKTDLLTNLINHYICITILNHIIMKKLMILISAITLISCNNSKCYECETIIHRHNHTSYNIDTMYRFICDKDEQGVRNYENENTYIIRNGLYIYEEYKTECK